VQVVNDGQRDGKQPRLTKERKSLASRLDKAVPGPMICACKLGGST